MIKLTRLEDNEIIYVNPIGINTMIGTDTGGTGINMGNGGYLRVIEPLDKVVQMLLMNDPMQLMAQQINAATSKHAVKQ